MSLNLTGNSEAAELQGMIIANNINFRKNFVICLFRK